MGLKQSERQLFTGYHSQDIAQTADWNIPPIYLSWNFGMRGRLQVCHISSSYKGVLREYKPGNTIFVLSLGLAIAHWYLLKEAYTLIWSPKFCNHCPRETFRWMGLEHSRVYHCDSMRLYIVAYFKSYCLASNQPELLGHWGSSLWNADRSRHTLNNRDLSRINQAA